MTTASPAVPVEPFGARLHAAMADRGPLCAGIDPHAALLREWGLDDDVAGLERFALTAVEALAPHVPVIKPQSAFYERFGSRGIAVLERVVAEARAAGALVLLDVKRGDIGSTSQAYADAYLDPASPLACDAITVSPFLGFGSLDPMIETARAPRRRGLRPRPDLQPRGPRGPARPHRRRARPWPAPSWTACAGSTPRTTPPASAARLLRRRRRRHDHRPRAGLGIDLVTGGPVLAPGFGAQGGTAADLRRIFGAAAGSVLASSSRELLRSGPSPERLRRARAAPARGPGRPGAARVTRRRLVRGGRWRCWCWRPWCSAPWSACGSCAARRRSATATRWWPAGPSSPRTLATDTGDGLLRALPVFEDLGDAAPADLARRVAHARHGPAGAQRGPRRTPASTPRRTTATTRPTGLTDTERDRIDAAAAPGRQPGRPATPWPASTSRPATSAAPR